MKIEKIIVSEIPRGCIDCPMNHSRECGTIKPDNGNGTVRYYKKADERCLIEVQMPFN